MMKRPVFPAAVLLVLSLAACGGDTNAEVPVPDPEMPTFTSSPDDAVPEVEPSTEDPPTLDETTASAPDPASPAVPTAPSAAGMELRPGSDQCSVLPEADDGLYQVADAGSIRMTREGDTLTLEETLPGAGWQTSTDVNEAKEVEVEFERNGVELDFEAEVAGGVLEIDICQDDDD